MADDTGNYKQYRHNCECNIEGLLQSETLLQGFHHNPSSPLIDDDTGEYKEVGDSEYCPALSGRRDFVDSRGELHKGYAIDDSQHCGYCHGCCDWKLENEAA